MMEEDADVDEDVAKVLEGADGDPDKIRENVRPSWRGRKAWGQSTNPTPRSY
jgi:hypothetical protein